jgi:sulfotransferase family protein
VSAESGPLVIAGVGGSGTRVFDAIARAAGRQMGDRVNESSDALELMDWADRWLGPYHAVRVAGEQPADVQRMRDELEQSVARHRAGAIGPWGWKQPRSIHFLPFLHEAYPDLRFLHVIRDGRDVAFGRQAPTVLENAGDAVLGPAWRSRPLPVALIELWSVANELAADYGEGAMGAGYLRVRFEDLCTDAGAVASRVGDFAGAGPHAIGMIDRVARRVQWPRSIGAWRRADPEQRDAVQRAGDSALRRFGYGDTRFRRPLGALLSSATRRARPS